MTEQEIHLQRIKEYAEKILNSPSIANCRALATAIKKQARKAYASLKVEQVSLVLGYSVDAKKIEEAIYLHAEKPTYEIQSLLNDKRFIFSRLGNQEIQADIESLAIALECRK